MEVLAVILGVLIIIFVAVMSFVVIPFALMTVLGFMGIKISFWICVCIVLIFNFIIASLKNIFSGNTVAK
jgi:hypothetical protein